jgi:hypothetical protein
VKKKRRRATKGGFVSAGGTGFTGKRPKDKRVTIGKGGFAGGVKSKATKIGGKLKSLKI